MGRLSWLPRVGFAIVRVTGGIEERQCLAVLLLALCCASDNALLVPLS